MKTYEVIFDEKNDKGVYALSCVENPAMEDLWVTLGEHHKEIQFAAVDEEKRLLLGAALIPNKKIHRNINGEEFDIVFPAKTIEACAHSFIKNGFQNNSSENHEIELKGVSVVESWIVADPETDKSKSFGKTFEKGTWVTMMKVDNDDTWAKAKNGTLNGFSIDGLFSLKEINLKSNTMSKQSMADTFKEVMVEMGWAKKEVNLGQLTLKDGKTKLEFEGDKPEIGKPIFVISGDDKIPAPEGEHELENGGVVFVDKNGLIAEKVEEEENTDHLTEIKQMMLKFKKEQDKAIDDLKESHKIELKSEQDKIKDLELKLEKKPASTKIVRAELTFSEPKTKNERLRNAIDTAVKNLN